jgi:hypothetical protein
LGTNNKELFSLERDFDKESDLGEIGRGNCGLEGCKTESALRGLLDKEMVEIFESEPRG